MFNASTPYEPPTPIFRATNYEQRYLLCAEQVHVVRVHWFQKSLLCTDTPDCPACQEAWQERTVVYVAAVAGGGKRGLLELPLQCAAKLEAAQERKELLGRILSVKRGATAINCEIEFLPVPAEGRVRAMESDDVKDQLCRVYSLPRKRDFNDLGKWQQEVKAVARKRLSFALQSTMTDKV